jgi:hypothetical protein
MTETTDPPGPAAQLDQLQQLGQQVLDAVVAAYDPDGTSPLALALHPGQSLADDVVQGGVANPLRVSSWLADQYDFPLRLALSQGSPIVSTALGGVTATSAYVTMARWCVPGPAADSAAFPRIAQLIADAREDLGTDPDQLPLGCEPGDFATPTCSGWRTFDTTVTTHAQQEATTPRPHRPPVLDDRLWKLRALSPEVLAAVPGREAEEAQVRLASRELIELPRADAAVRVTELTRNAVVQPVAPAEDAAAGGGPDRAVLTRTAVSRAALVAGRPGFDRAVPAETVAPRLALDRAVAFRTFAARSTLVRESLRAEPTSGVRIGDEVDDVRFSTPDILSRSRQVRLGDLETEPAVSVVTTQDTALHVHFEFMTVAITRRDALGKQWWHPDLLQERSWYVPGMAAGALVAPTDDPGFGWCVPQSLLLVRNVTLTGVFSQEAQATMGTGLHYVGPFLLGPPQVVGTEAGQIQQTAVVGSGIQVIGELCSPLPVLPPMNDPYLPTPPDPAPAGAAPGDPVPVGAGAADPGTADPGAADPGA